MNADVVNGLLNGGDLLGFFIRNFALELFFQSHYQLNGVEGVGAQIVHEGRLDFDFGFVHAQLFGNDLLNARFDVFHLFKPMTFLIRDNKTPVFYKKIRAAYLNLQAGCKPVYGINMPPLTCSVWPVM